MYRGMGGRLHVCWVFVSCYVLTWKACFRCQAQPFINLTFVLGIERWVRACKSLYTSPKDSSITILFKYGTS